MAEVITIRANEGAIVTLDENWRETVIPHLILLFSVLDGDRPF